MWPVEDFPIAELAAASQSDAAGAHASERKGDHAQVIARENARVRDAVRTGRQALRGCWLGRGFGACERPGKSGLFEKCPASTAIVFHAEIVYDGARQRDQEQRPTAIIQLVPPANRVLWRPYRTARVHSEFDRICSALEAKLRRMKFAPKMRTAV